MALLLEAATLCQCVRAAIGHPAPAWMHGLAGGPGCNVLSLVAILPSAFWPRKAGVQVVALGAGRGQPRSSPSSGLHSDGAAPNPALGLTAANVLMLGDLG